MNEEQNNLIGLLSTPGVTILLTGLITLFAGFLTLLIKNHFDNKRDYKIIKREIFSEVSKSLSGHKEAKKQLLDRMVTKQYYQRLLSLGFDIDPKSHWDRDKFHTEISYLTDQMSQLIAKQMLSEDNLSSAKAKFEIHFGFKQEIDDNFEKIVSLNIPVKDIREHFNSFDKDQIIDKQYTLEDYVKELWAKMNTELKVYDRFKQTVFNTLYPK